MDYEKMEDLPEAVGETLRAFALHLQGRGPAPDFDALDPGTLQLVDELIPEIAALVADKIVPYDDASGVGAGAVAIDGFRLRRARETLQLTAHELAVRVSAQGRTIGGTNIEAIEAAVKSDVDAALAAALADVLGVPVDDLAPDHRTFEQAVLQDVKWAHPPVEVMRDPIVTTFDVEPMLRLVLTDFGLVARVLVFDTTDVDRLRDDATLRAAAELAMADGGATSWFLLVAGREAERVTQLATVEEIRGAVRAPDGGHVTAPRMLPVALVDAVRFAFEEVAGASWDLASPLDQSGGALDADALAARCAAFGIAEATKTRARGEAKPAALAAIAAAETAALHRILAGVSSSEIRPGAEFRSTFETDLVGAA